MGYIITKRGFNTIIAKISESRGHKGFCSDSCSLTYKYNCELYCAAFGDTIHKRKCECYDAEKPIEFLKKNKKIKTKEKCRNHYLRSGYEYEFIKLTSKGKFINVTIIDWMGNQNEFDQENFDWKDLLERYYKEGIIND